MKGILKLIALISLSVSGAQAQERLAIEEVRELLSDEYILCFDPVGRECSALQVFEFVTPTRGMMVRVILNHETPGIYLRSQTYMGFRALEDELCYSA